MSGEEWVAFSEDSAWGLVVRAARALGSPEPARAESAQELRALALAAEPGAVSVLVGPGEGGVSDVNLAAAVAADGAARRVVLVVREASGSLRSRASCAGIDLVLDAADVAEFVPDERAAKAESTLTLRPDELAGRAPVIAFCSGRGGVGKTSIAAMAAASASAWGMRVVLVDLDLSCGNLASCFGRARGCDLAACSRRGDAIRSALDGAPEIAPGVRLVGPCEKPEEAELSFPLVGPLIRHASCESDLVLVDTSTTFTDACAQAAQLSDRLAIVTDGRPGSLAAMARVGGLAVRLGVARTRIARVENRASRREAPNFALGRAEVGLEAARVFQVLDGHDEVADFLSAGRVGELVGSGSPFARTVEAALAQILAELGALPDSSAAQAAAERTHERRGLSLFGKRREAR